jgi:hypothetical protein
LGEVDWESIYVGLDVTSVDKPEVELTVVVTDLNAPATLQVEKAIHFVVVGTGTQTAGQASE